MSDRPTNASLEALRQTLQRVEGDSGLAPDDEVLVELKRILLMRIAAREADGLSELVEPATPAALAPEPNPADEPAVAIAIDLAISLLASHLIGRPFESNREVLEEARSGRDAD